MPKKPPIETVEPTPTLIDRQVWSRDFKQVAGVRSVSVILHLDNGHDEVYREGQQVQVVKE